MNLKEKYTVFAIENMIESENDHLPNGWKTILLDDVGKIETGSTPSKAETTYYGKEYPFFKPTDLEQGINTISAFDNLSIKGYDKSRKLPKNSILVTCIGATIGKTGLIKVEGASNQQINSIIPCKLYNPKFVYYQLISSNLQNQIKNNASSTTLPILNKSKFKQLRFNTAPKDIQDKIVFKIEELFSELDKGIESLKLAQQQLKVYRQSVLKWAFEGRLTNENVKEGELPEGWKLTKIADATISLDNLRKPINKTERLKRTGTIPYYGANGRVGWIDDYIFDESLICVVEDETFTGREIPFSYKITGKTWVNNHAHVLRPRKDLNLDFLNYQLYYYPFLPLTTGTTGRKKLTKNALMNAPIKICSLNEQIKIVAEIESRLSVTDKMEESINQSLLQSEALRQSILKRAFEGSLIDSL